MISEDRDQTYVALVFHTLFNIQRLFYSFKTFALLSARLNEEVLENTQDQTLNQSLARNRKPEEPYL